MSVLSQEDSSMAASYIIHAASQHYQQLTDEMTWPFNVLRPRMFIDGDQWCALYGEDLQSGVAGFGKSPHEASRAFNEAWYATLPAKDTP